MTKAQQTGIAGTYLVAAELALRGLNAVVTSRNMKGTDILVEDPQTGISASVQVKANRTTFSFWLVGDIHKVPVGKKRFFVLVNIRKRRIEFFVVPSAKAVEIAIPNNNMTGCSINLPRVEPHRDAWNLIEEALAS